MGLNFTNLSATDFEDLSRDLIGRALGVRFEAFSAGPDDGIDGRFAKSISEPIILQAKHYANSSFSALKGELVRERAKVDRLGHVRYVLSTSRGLTPANKGLLKAAMEPFLQSEADIYGADDLAALLREFPEVEKAHPKLWMASAAVLREVVKSAVTEAIGEPRSVPSALATLLPSSSATPEPEAAPARDVLFISKSPHDAEFTLWLAPKLEAAGYRVFADILTLEPGDRWRKERTLALRNRAAKLLVLCSDETLANEDVSDDLAVAIDLAAELGDAKFIVPLRLKTHKKVHGLGDTVSVNFTKGWAEGLEHLLETLQRQKTPRSETPQINSNWEIFRRRGAVTLSAQPERLTSNWLHVSEAPDSLNYFEPVGSIDRSSLSRALPGMPYPVVTNGAGFLSFASADEINTTLSDVGRFEVKKSLELRAFVAEGYPRLGITRQVASNAVFSIFKVAWAKYCMARGLVEYRYSTNSGFHVSPDGVKLGQRIPWRRQREQRWSMLRNAAKGHIWAFGLTAIPSFAPFFHFKLKARVLFSVENPDGSELRLDDAKRQHRLRRSVCKGWRNKQWHGRLLAYLEYLSEESAYLRLPLASDQYLVLDATPVLFTSPISTALPDQMDDEDEEQDASTLGRPEPDEVEA